MKSMTVLITTPPGDSAEFVGNVEAALSCLDEVMLSDKDMPCAVGAGALKDSVIFSVSTGADITPAYLEQRILGSLDGTGAAVNVLELADRDAPTAQPHMF